MSIAMTRALQTPDLTPMECFVLAFLVGEADANRTVSMSVREIQARLKIKTRTTLCGITMRLREAGWLDVRRRFGAEAIYTVVDQDGWLYGAADAAESAENRAENRRKPPVSANVQKTGQRQNVQKTGQSTIVQESGQSGPEAVHSAGQSGPKTAPPNVQKTGQDSISTLKESLRPSTESHLHLLSPPPPPARSRKRAPVVVAVEDIRAVVDAWNVMAKRTGLPCVKVVSERRRRHLAMRVKEHGVPGILEAVENIGASAFCHGTGDRGWFAHFDFLISPDGCVKAREGIYNRDRVKKPNEGVTDSLRRRLNLWAEQDDDDDRPNAPTIDQPLALEHVG